MRNDSGYPVQLRLWRAFLLSLALPLAVVGAARAQTEFLVNGDFETGTLTGWQIPGIGFGGFIADNNNLDPLLDPSSPSAPFSRLATVGASAGNFYAVSDSLGPGAQALIQTFTIPAGTANITLSFDMFVNDWNGAGALNTMGHPFEAVYETPTQFARVDLMSSAGDVFSNNGALANFYLGVDESPEDFPPFGYTSYAFDITALTGAGGTFRLRFITAANQFTINQGVDNVSILGTITAPEPASMHLFVAGMSLLSMIIRRRIRQTTPHISQSIGVSHGFSGTN